MSEYLQGRENTEMPKAKEKGPDYYLKMPVQVWDVVDTWPIEQQIGFYRGGVLKYTMRLGVKDAATEEIKKAAHYAQKLAEVMERYADER